MRDDLRIGVVMLLAVLVLGSALPPGRGALAQGRGPAVDWWVVAGGGTASEGSGGVALQDTLGQPIAGPSSGAGGQVALRAGYRAGSAPAHRLYLPLVLRAVGP